jgi:hypothetical protein
MNRRTCVGILSGAVAFAGVSAGGCVNGNIPPQQTNTPEGGSGSAESGSGGGAGASSSNDGGNGASSGSGGASSQDGARGEDGEGPGQSSGGSSDGAAGSSGGGVDGGSSEGSSGSGSSSGGNLDAAAISDSPFTPDSQSISIADGAAVPCIAGIYGYYALRGDGTVIVPGSTSVVLDAATALPLMGVTGIQGGSSHGCAVLVGGSVACWQTVATTGNAYGQLGNGTTTASSVLFRSTPVLTGASTPLTNVVAFATGADPLNSTCAVTGDHKLWCWGDLTWIVNNGIALHSPYAQAITVDGLTALTGVVQATFANTGACAVVQGSPNTVWCWGVNGSSELAQGDTTNRQYPVKVLGLTAPTKVVIASYGNLQMVGASTANTICAIDGGNIRCWGVNVNGAAGVNSTATPITSPKFVVLQNGTTMLDGVTDLEPGISAFSALRTDGTLWHWGYGFTSYGSNYGLTNVVAVAYAGGYGGNSLGIPVQPRFLTSDDAYHNGMIPVAVNCGALQ